MYKTYHDFCIEEMYAHINGEVYPATVMSMVYVGPDGQWYKHVNEDGLPDAWDDPEL